MADIREVIENSLQLKIDEHTQLGGALRISVYEIHPDYMGSLPKEYEAHLITARQTLERQNYEWNLNGNKAASINRRNSWPYAITDFDILDNSGQRIELKQFLGSYLEPETNKLNLNPKIREGFIRVLTEPPFSMKFSHETVEKEEYVLGFLKYFFNDINRIVIYSWSADCSVVFNSGKEWWGIYFWTIYNPVKQWYIGITASQTD